MTKNLRTAALSAAAGGALTLLALMVGPAGSARADTVGIDLEATTGSVSLPAKGGTTTSVPVLGYCLRTAPDTPCGPVTAPGGPTLTVTVGDEVTIHLHNTLAESTSLYLGGQPLVPDTTGAAAKTATETYTATYTFTASRAGTYLYEAGLTKNHQHQVAMGLYGALVVKPASAGQAYDAETAFEKEQVLVLSEVDPALNTSADPSAFDMRNFAPRWTLVNGQPHPDIPSIAADGGDRVLLRWVNAGSPTTRWGCSGPSSASSPTTATGWPTAAATSPVRSWPTPSAPARPPTRSSRCPPRPSTARWRCTRPTSGCATPTPAPPVACSPSSRSPVRAEPTTRSAPWPATSPGTPATLSATFSDAATGGGTVASAEWLLDTVVGTGAPMDGTFGTRVRRRHRGRRHRLRPARRVRARHGRRGQRRPVELGPRRRQRRRRPHHHGAHADPGPHERDVRRRHRGDR